MADIQTQTEEVLSLVLGKLKSEVDKFGVAKLSTTSDEDKSRAADTISTLAHTAETLGRLKQLL